MTTQRDSLDEQIARVEAVVSEFEQNNPEIVEAMESVGMSIDEYERIVSGMNGVIIETSSSTG